MLDGCHSVKNLFHPNGGSVVCWIHNARRELAWARMAEEPNRIELLVAELQKLPMEVRRLHAQQDVITALASGTLPIRRLWTQRADRIIALADKIGFARIIVTFAALVLTLVLDVRQYGTKRGVAAGGARFWAWTLRLRKPSYSGRSSCAS